MIKVIIELNGHTVIQITKEELKAYGLKLGDMVDVELCKMKGGNKQWKHKQQHKIG